MEDSDPALIAAGASPPHDYELQRGEDGFGMDIGSNATVVFFSGHNSAAKRAGMPIGRRITKVDGVAVGTKDEVLAQLAAAGATVVFTVAGASPVDTVRPPPPEPLPISHQFSTARRICLAGLVWRQP